MLLDVITELLKLRIFKKVIVLYLLWGMIQISINLQN